MLNVVNADPSNGTDEGVFKVSFPEEVTKGSRLWPEVRVIREASIDDFEYGPDWSHYLNVLGKENRGRGKAFALGSIAVTLVGAQEMNVMLRDKYPKLFQKSHRSKSLQLMRRTAKSINNFIVNNEAETVKASYNSAQAAAELRIAQQEDPDAIYPDLEGLAHPHYRDDTEATRDVSQDDIREASQSTGVIWRPGFFDCKADAIDKFGTDRLGIDLSGSAALQRERAALSSFFSQLEFDTTLMDERWKPHFAPFQTLNSLGKVALTIPDSPKAIYLEKPKAAVNDNNPV